ncbi:MAG TPA: flagellar protein export ATPase FliI [Hyphomicrobiaceae bacterium]|nr:flagellar protein export ATPase FliI [Hyphomicrobiaceae bacterium]
MATAHTPSPPMAEAALPAAPAHGHTLDRLEHWLRGALATAKIATGGIVSEVTPAYYRVSGLSRVVQLGECLELDAGGRIQLGEVVRIDATGATVKSFEPTSRAGLGAIAWHRGFITFNPDPSWKGRVINALANPIDGKGPLLKGERCLSADREPPAPMQRHRVRAALKTGVRVLDLFTPLCAGQRVGVFAGSGIGKSTLLSMLARSQGFDSTVIALVGERGREVREFLEDALGQGRARAVTVVATGDESPMMRRLAPKTALSIAEFLRDRGENVLLIIDSITRFAHAAREVALAAGEPPVARGYAPSVFSDLPKLLERAGPGPDGVGSITGIFSVLVDGDDHNDPVADSIRGTLDGHIVLDRGIADQGRYPAVNVLSSVSRLARVAWTADEAKLISMLRALVARFEDTRDLRLMGGYRSGTDPELDRAIGVVPRVYEVLRQGPQDGASTDAFQDMVRALAADAAQAAPATRPPAAQPGELPAA